MIRISYLRLVLIAAAVCLLAAALGPLLPRLYDGARSLVTVRHLERRTLEVLKQHSLKFLVTDKIVSQIVVEADDSNPLLGKREGYLIAKAKLYYGIDLDELDEKDVIRQDNAVVVRLPQPKELDFAVDLDSLKFISKRSGLMVIADWITNKDQEEELRGQFKSAAIAYMKDEQLIPSKADIVNRLNEFASLFSARVGKQLVFE